MHEAPGLRHAAFRGLPYAGGIRFVWFGITTCGDRIDFPRRNHAVHECGAQSSQGSIASSDLAIVSPMPNSR